METENRKKKTCIQAILRRVLYTGHALQLFTIHFYLHFAPDMTGFVPYSGFSILETAKHERQHICSISILLHSILSPCGPHAFSPGATVYVGNYRIAQFPCFFICQARCSMPSDFDSDYAYALGAVLGGRRTRWLIRSRFEILISLNLADTCRYMMNVIFDICFFPAFLSWLCDPLEVLLVICTNCSKSLHMFAKYLKDDLDVIHLTLWKVVMWWRLAVRS